MGAVLEQSPQEFLLTPNDVERRYGIAISTQYVWNSTNRYGWHAVTIKVGGRIRYRRADIEAWLEKRKGLVS